MEIFSDQQMIQIKTLKLVHLGRYIRPECMQLNVQVAVLIIILVLLYGVYEARVCYQRGCRDDLCGRR